MPTPPRWLTALLQIRRQHRDDCRRQLNDAQRAESVLAQNAEVVANQIAELTAVKRQASLSRECDLNLLLSAQRHQSLLQAEHTTTFEQLNLVRQEMERRRANVVAAEQQVRSLELLSERKVQDARRAEDRRETRRLDEVAAILHKPNNPS